MTDTPTGAWLSVRPARTDDRERLFEWANDPLTRRNSFSPSPIAWTTHCEWFDRLLADPTRLLLIVLNGADAPIGQARFDRAPGRAAQISVALVREWRGRKLAAAAIEVATREALIRMDVDAVDAYIKEDNEPSRRAFLRAGYEQLSVADRSGDRVIHLRRVRGER